MPDVVHGLLATEAAIGKLGARNISADEAGQLARNEHVTVRNPHGEEAETRRLMIGRTDGGRLLKARDRANHRAHHLADRDRLEVERNLLDRQL
jgi:hypothetical protein